MPDAAPRVVLIEDNPLIRTGQRMLLEHAGYRVAELASAADLAGFDARSGGRQAIIADYDLGPGKTGIQVALEIMDRSNQRIPTLVLSASLGARSLVDAAAVGMPVMFKPAHEEKVLAWVAEAFRRQSAEPPGDAEGRCKN